MMNKEEALKKLKGHIKPDTGEWKRDLQWRMENKAWLTISQKIAFEVLQALRTQKKTKKDLAGIMNVSFRQVDRWVKGRDNFTLATLTGLEQALNISLINWES